MWEIDANVLLFIQDNVRVPVLTPVMQALSLTGDFGGLFWIVMALTLLVIKRTRKVGLSVAISLAIMGLINNACIKLIVNRTRPYVAIEGLSILVKEPHDSSFPSGHSALAFAASTALILALPMIMEKKVAIRIGIAFYILAALIAFSRLYVGVHYPTDVIGGSVLGVVYGVAGTFVARRIIEWYESRGDSSLRSE